MFMNRLLPILIAAAVLFQSLIGAASMTGTVCFGGGHEHPDSAKSQGCELDCSHASNRIPLPAPVEDNHPDCPCIDIDFSISELLTTLPRMESTSTAACVPAPFESPLIGFLDFRPIRYWPPVPSWFDPGGTQRVTHLSTTRLIV